MHWDYTLSALMWALGVPTLALPQKWQALYPLSYFQSYVLLPTRSDYPVLYVLQEALALSLVKHIPIYNFNFLH